MGFTQKFSDAATDSFPRPKRDYVFSTVHQKFWKDSGEITIDVLEEMYQRNGLAHNIINLLVRKTFKKGFDTEENDEKIEKELQTLNRRKKVTFMRTVSDAQRWRWVFGCSAVILGYKDGGAELKDPVKNPVDIVELAVVDKRDIKRFIYEDELNNSGEIVAMELYGSKVGLSADITIDRSRFILFGQPSDKGILFPAFNWLELFDNNAWSAGQSFFRYGSGFPFLKITGADTTEIAAAEAMWKNVTARTGMVGDERYDLDFKGSNGRALPVKDYHEVGLQLVCMATGLSYALVVGAHAGAVTGSETNSAELYDYIEAIQTEQVEPVLYEFFEKFNEVGLLSRSDFIIKWIPLWQLSQKEIAELEKSRADTDHIYLTDGVISKDEIRRKREFKMLDPDPEYDLPEKAGTEYKATIPFSGPGTGGFQGQSGGDPSSQNRNVSPPTGNTGSDAAPLPLSKLEDNAAIEEMIASASKKIEGLYDWDSLKEAITKLDTPSSDSAATSDDRPNETLAKIDITIDSNQAGMRRIVDDIIDSAYQAGVINGEEELGKEIPLSASAKAARATLKSQLFEIVKGLNADVKRQLRNDLLDELQKANGTNLPQVRARLIERLETLRKTLPEWRIGTIARTETNRAFNSANYDTYQTAGVQKIMLLTARDERVRPTHAAVDGEVVPIGTPFSNGYLRPPFDPNCRCSIIPVIESSSG